MASPSGNHPLDTSKLECGVCYELLLDPVVGSCGHDFCRNCLERWRSQQRQQGREVRCPVCRGVFADSFDKLGVCVRLREMVELLFPDKIAARRADVEKQAAAERKRTAARVEQEDVPQPPVFAGVSRLRAARRRLHARRHNTQQASAAGSSAPAAAGTSQIVPLAPAAAAGAAPSHGSQLLLNVTANTSNNNGSSMSFGYSLSAQQLQQMQVAIATAAANQLQHLGGLQQPGTVTWPILDVHFTMGWYEGGERSCRAAARRNRCRRRAARS